MTPDALWAERQDGAWCVRPAASVHVLNAGWVDAFAGFVVVRMAAKDVVHVAVHRVFDGFPLYFSANPNPTLALPLQPAADTARARFALLYCFVELARHSADDRMIREEVVELMTVHEQVALSGHFDEEFFLYIGTDHGADDVVGSFVVVAFNPIDTDSSPGAGKPTKIIDQSKMVFTEAGKIQVLEEVAQNNETPKGVPFLKGLAELSCPGNFTAEVDIGDNERVGTEGTVGHPEPDFVCGLEGLLFA